LHPNATLRKASGAFINVFANARRLERPPQQSCRVQTTGVVMDQPHEVKDYVDLWKYFQERAETIKQNMFQTVTWLLGLSAGLLGYTLSTFVKFDTAQLSVKYPEFGLLFCALGLAICIYAGLLLHDYGSHIQSNWNRADYCKEKVAELDQIIQFRRNKAQRRVRVPIWWQIGVIVLLFAAAFVFLGGVLVGHFR
jgi:hypothetical protein